MEQNSIIKNPLHFQIQLKSQKYWRTKVHFGPIMLLKIHTFEEIKTLVKKN